MSAISKKEFLEDVISGLQSKGDILHQLMFKLL